MSTRVRVNYPDYDASEAAAIVFVVAFGISAIAHIAQASMRKSWWMWPLIVGVLGEVAGYLTRYLSITQSTNTDLWLASMLLIILAPNFLAATDYILMARLMLFVAPELSVISPKWIGTIFIACDLLALALQGAGGGSLGSVRTPASLNRAKAILISGLVFQLITFGLFAVVILVFWQRCKRAGVPKGPWVKLMAALAASAILILIRSVFRCIEFSKTTLGVVGSRAFVRSEAVIYVLEAVPILASCVVFNVIHPAWYLPNNKRERVGKGSEGLEGTSPTEEKNLRETTTVV
ncbi:RTA1 like protein-domain-containing protein [Mrakia frigida]|uniref:RTA1 domain-containing protein n=1 Tax=Mrakia frigida TaxID=29902 RepID=UPI003FCBF1F0